MKAEGDRRQEFQDAKPQAPEAGACSHRAPLFRRGLFTVPNGDMMVCTALLARPEQIHAGQSQHKLRISDPTPSLCVYTYLGIGFDVLAVQAGAVVAVLVVGKAVTVQLEALALLAVAGALQAGPVHQTAQHSAGQQSTADMSRVQNSILVIISRLGCTVPKHPNRHHHAACGGASVLMTTALPQPVYSTTPSSLRQAKAGHTTPHVRSSVQASGQHSS